MLFFLTKVYKYTVCFSDHVFVNDMLSVPQTFNSRYHHQLNGVIENFHNTLKQMLVKVTAKFLQGCDIYLPVILFAYRDVPQKTTV